MRARSSIAVLLLLAAALAAAPSPISASPLPSWNQGASWVAALDQAWRMVKQWLPGGSAGPSTMTKPAGNRTPGARQQGGASADPNGGGSANSNQGAIQVPTGTGGFGS
jgi:hypothetical protein